MLYKLVFFFCIYCVVFLLLFICLFSKVHRSLEFLTPVQILKSSRSTHNTTNFRDNLFFNFEHVGTKI